MNKLLCCCVVILCAHLPFAYAQDQEVNFTATPKQCVALHKGQTCFQTIEFKWTTPTEGKYCLLQADNQQRLICWQGNFVQQYQYSFKNNKTTKYHLIDQVTTRPLGEVKVVVAWVYKAPKQSRSGWRLF